VSRRVTNDCECMVTSTLPCGAHWIIGFLLRVDQPNIRMFLSLSVGELFSRDAITEETPHSTREVLNLEARWMVVRARSNSVLRREQSAYIPAAGPRDFRSSMPSETLAGPVRGLAGA